MNIGTRIKTKRKELGLSVDDVARMLDKDRATVYRYESNDIAKLPITVIEPLSRILDTSPSYLMGWDDENLKPPEITENVILFPVIGEIAAGYDTVADENWSGDTVCVPSEYLKGRKREDFFVLSVIGDSMYPLYMEGDKVMILKQNTLNRSGDIGAVLYDNEFATLKKIEYVMGENWMEMIPVNPAFKPKRIENADLERCHILGIPWLLIREIG